MIGFVRALLLGAYKGDQAYTRSPLSYASKREALAEGEIVLGTRIAAWEAARS
jgi:hypothetical protein